MSEELMSGDGSVCVGRTTIERLASSGSVQFDNGTGLVAADDLFHASPYDRIASLERDLAAERAAHDVTRAGAAAIREILLRPHHHIACAPTEPCDVCRALSATAGADLLREVEAMMELSAHVWHAASQHESDCGCWACDAWERYSIAVDAEARRTK